MTFISNHFDGKHYYNNPRTRARGIREVLKWVWNRKITPWSYKEIEVHQVKNQRVKTKELWVTFINHATVLIQVEGWNILTDPIWSERASPFSKIGPKRMHAPGIKFKDLPPIDVVLISHNHYDHLDLKTLKRLEKVHHPHFYISKGNVSLLKIAGLKKVKELDWWDFSPLSNNTMLHFVPAQHFSGRGIWDHNKTLWGGFVLKTPFAMVYFAGDTGYGPHFKDIKERLGSPTLSLLPIGPVKPEWFMRPVHMSPKEAVQAHFDLSSRQSLAIHFGTFQLGDEGMDEAPQQLKKELKKQKLFQDTFWLLEPGEGREINLNL